MRSALSRPCSHPADLCIATHHLLVRRIAHAFERRLPAGIDLDDLVQAGLIGLCEASHNYDPSQGASFTTYATIRIRGAILDEVRRSDWVPRSVHRKARAAANAICLIEQQTGQPAHPQDVARAMNLSVMDYSRLAADMSRGHMLSMEAHLADHGEIECAAQDVRSPLHMLERQEFHRELKRQIECLPARERAVLTLYYDQEMTLKEIGQRLEMSESRSCQIHSQAITRLRTRLYPFHLSDVGISDN